MNLGVFPSGQWGQTVNLLLFSFGGSNPPAPTKKTSVENTLVFCFARHLKSHPRGWIRTAAEPTAACGGNREARLGPRPAGCERQRSRRWEPQPGFLIISAARAIHPRPPKKLNAWTCAELLFWQKVFLLRGCCTVHPTLCFLPEDTEEFAEKEKSTSILNGSTCHFGRSSGI